MIKGDPPGTLGLGTQSGWMNGKLFPRVLNHFIKHMGCSIENPAVVFMDNHESHFDTKVIEMARMSGLSIITFPPHTSHKLQPLDVAVYGPLKCHYKKAVNEWNLSHPASRITIYDLPECFSRAFFELCLLKTLPQVLRKQESGHLTLKFSQMTTSWLLLFFQTTLWSKKLELELTPPHQQEIYVSHK